MVFASKSPKSSKDVVTMAMQVLSWQQVIVWFKLPKLLHCQYRIKWYILLIFCIFKSFSVAMVTALPWQPLLRQTKDDQEIHLVSKFGFDNLNSFKDIII